MPRRKPTPKLDVIGQLDIDPVRAISEYIASKQQDAYFVNPPNWHSAGDSVELLYIRNVNEYNAMKRLQAEMRESASRQQASNEDRTRMMYKQQAHLRKRFIEVNSFFKDCEDKRRVAEKKVQEEKTAHVELHRNISYSSALIHDLTKFRDVLSDTVKEYEPYEQVIMDVVEKSDIYSTVKDCMDRCDALMLAQVEISNLQQEKIQEIEDMRKTLIQMTNEVALTLLGFQNDLAEVERAYNQARAECMKWEKLLGDAKSFIGQNDMDRERTLDAIHHLYKLLCNHIEEDPKYNRSDVEEQLDFIKYEVEMIQRVIREHNKRTATSDYTEKAGVKC